MINKHKTTKKHVEKMLPDIYNTVGAVSMGKLFVEAYDRSLSLRERRRRMTIIKNAKLEAERAHKALAEAYGVAMQDVIDNGGTLL